MFRVHGNKRLTATFTKKIDKNYVANIGNTGFITTDFGKVKSKKTYVEITSTTKPQNTVVNETHGFNDIFRLTKGTNDPKDGDVDWQSYKYGTVTPGQHIIYTLHFKIKKPLI